MNIQDFLESDRQWLRPQRVAHCKYQLTQAKLRKDREAMAFWSKCVQAIGEPRRCNGGHENI